MQLTSRTIWAIAPNAAHLVMALMARRLGVPGGEVTPMTAAGAKPSMQGRGNGKIAVIPIYGVLTNDGPAYYGSNYQTISNAIEQSANDPDVKRIIVPVDTPGGEVTGLPECAAVIAAAAKVKQVSVIVEGTCASAGYWLASQASDIALTPSGEVGSVGVRMMHVDMSKMLDDAGYKITELSSGKFKTEWSPHKPVSKDAQADMQTRLDRTHKDFIASVAAGRGRRASASISKSRFGEGRMFSADDALFHGLVDRLQSPRSFMRAVVSAPPTTSHTANFGASSDRSLSVIRARLDLALLRA